MLVRANEATEVNLTDYADSISMDLVIDEGVSNGNSRYIAYLDSTDYYVAYSDLTGRVIGQGANAKKAVDYLCEALTDKDAIAIAPQNNGDQAGADALKALLDAFAPTYYVVNNNSTLPPGYGQGQGQ